MLLQIEKTQFIFGVYSIEFSLKLSSV